MPKLRSLGVYRLQDGKITLRTYAKGKLNWLEGIGSIDGAEVEFGYAQSKLSAPDWATWLSELATPFPELRSTGPRALLLIRDGSGRGFALPFGVGGWSLLDPSSIESGWGRRIALNLLYDPLTGSLIEEGRLLRKQRATKLGRGVTKETQTSKPSAHEEFGFNRVEEILRSATVSIRRKNWGRHVEGSDSFKLRWKGSLKDLPGLLGQLDVKAQEVEYKKHFDFVDDLIPVKDPNVISSVWDAASASIRSGRIASLGLTTPGPEDLAGLDFALLRISGIKSKRGGRPLSGLELSSYRKLLKKCGILNALDSEELAKQVIRGVDNGQTKLEISVQRAVEGTVTFGNSSYALLEGTVYEIASSFVRELDVSIDRIDDSAAASLKLPALNAVTPRAKTYKKKTIMVQDERAYNAFIAIPSDRIMLDAKNVVTVPGRTSAVEICDVLVDNGTFIHVKLGTGSGTLSHLFAQASVSCELMVQSKEFINQSRIKIKDVATAAGKTHKPFVACLKRDIRSGNGKTIVLGIVSGRWSDKKGKVRKLSRVLPFFSKVNLRRAAVAIEQRAFRLRVARIEE